LVFITLSVTGQTVVYSHQKISDTQGQFAGIIQNGDSFGSGTCCIGDLDGDGINDIAVGARKDDDGGTDNGAVWILFLNNNGSVKSYQKISQLQGGFSGTLTQGCHFGETLDTIGDLNGDGVVDLAVGTHYDSDGGAWHGAVWILFMNSNGTVKDEQKISDLSGGFNASFTGACTFGSAIAPIGDFDGDSILDIAVGMRRDPDGGSSQVGSFFLIYLYTDGTVKSYNKISATQGNFLGNLDNGDHFSCEIANLGDLDGDGVIDLAVGAHSDDDGGSNKGAVWIIFLNQSGTVKSFQKISSTMGNFNGVLDNGDTFGCNLEAIEDIDGDGIKDLVVGAQNDDDGGQNHGAIWILYLDSNGTVKNQDKISSTYGSFTGILDVDDRLGTAVSIINDLNGNGVPAILGGAEFDDDGSIDAGALWVLFIGSSPVVEPGNAMLFDGIDDYIDLGPDAGNGVRTIELWFNPENDINSSLADYESLVVRNNGLTNEHEITLAFSPEPLDKGKLYFGVRDSNSNLFIVYSNSDSWNADQWYHVAGVIHPNLGMMMFVDGIMQADTDPYTNATTHFSTITTIGSWGDYNLRFFNGIIDDVRFSSDAVYTSNFTPPCPDLMTTASTIGLWNFNGNLLITAVDSSANHYNGFIVGASRITQKVCDTTVSIFDNLSPGKSSLVKVYPNPTTGIFNFRIENFQSKNNYQILIYDINGKMIRRKNLNCKDLPVDLRSLDNGIYLYRVKSNTTIVSSGRLFKI